jgi:hypothetical protein
MGVRLTSALFCGIGCCLLPAIVIVMALTYKEETDYGEPGPFPYSAVDYVFWADLFCTLMLILLTRGWRRVTALVSVPLLVATAVMVFFAGMWFSGNYL